MCLRKKRGRKIRLELQEDKRTRVKFVLSAAFREELSPESLTHDQDDRIGDQDQGHHLLHQAAAFIHQLVEVQQVFEIPECFSDLHPLKINGQSVFRFQVGHDPHGLGKAFLPDPDNIYKDLAFIEDLAFASDMQNIYPGINWRDARALLDDKTTPHMERLEIERYLREWKEYDPYKSYLTANELCKQSGLRPDDLSKLEATRLLLPDTKDRRYRPKLASWGRKLAYLLQEGWKIEEIQAWVKGRWKTANPRQWPPRKISIDN